MTAENQKQDKLNRNGLIRLALLSSGISLACNLHYGFATTYLNVPVDEFKVYLNESLRQRSKILTKNHIFFFFRCNSNRF